MTSRVTVRVLSLVAVTCLLLAGGRVTPVRSGEQTSVVATGVPRPLQVVADGSSLLVLSPGVAGDVAGELYRVPLGASSTVDLSRAPRLRIPFADRAMATLGSLAVHPVTHQIFLGEENGTRIHLLTRDGQLVAYAVGLHQLPGGSAFAFDHTGHLLVVDFADQSLRSRDEPVPPGLESFRDEDYRGPLLLRVDLNPDIALPRHLDRLPPLFPRAWRGGIEGALVPHFVSVAPLPGDAVAVVTSSGGVFRVGLRGERTQIAQLPPGQYLRTNMVSAPDGTLYVSGGLWVSTIARVTPDGTVSVVAEGLGDPQGLALAGDALYVAESSHHRIVRASIPR